MNLQNRATKLYIRELPPSEALQLFETYKVLTPYKEVLVALVNLKTGYPALDFLEENYGIRISYWTYNRIFKKALEQFYRCYSAKK